MTQRTDKLDCLSMEGRPFANRTSFSCSVSPVSWTFMYEPDLKINFLGEGFQKLAHYRQTDTQTDAPNAFLTMPVS